MPRAPGGALHWWCVRTLHGCAVDGSRGPASVERVGAWGKAQGHRGRRFRRWPADVWAMPVHAWVPRRPWRRGNQPLPGGTQPPPTELMPDARNNRRPSQLPQAKDPLPPGPELQTVEHTGHAWPVPLWGRLGCSSRPPRLRPALAPKQPTRPHRPRQSGVADAQGAGASGGPAPFKAVRTPQPRTGLGGGRLAVCLLRATRCQRRCLRCGDADRTVDRLRLPQSRCSPGGRRLPGSNAGCLPSRQTIGCRSGLWERKMRIGFGCESRTAGLRAGFLSADQRGHFLMPQPVPLRCRDPPVLPAPMSRPSAIVETSK